MDPTQALAELLDAFQAGDYATACEQAGYLHDWYIVRQGFEPNYNAITREQHTTLIKALESAAHMGMVMDAISLKKST